MKRNENPKCALVIGGTGLVGRELVKMLLADERFDRIVVFGRRPMKFSHPKLTEEIIDFSTPETWIDRVRGDVLFSALGTTLKQVGSKAAQYEVDFMYQYHFAVAASQNGVPQYVLVSSVGAQSRSPFFYLRMKGELEDAVATLPFERIVILRPCQLDGDRIEKRRGEAAGVKFTKAMNRIGLLRKRKPIHASVVASAMIESIHRESRKPVESLSGHELFSLSGPQP